MKLTLNFANKDNYVHDENKVDFSSGNAKLKDQRPIDLEFYAGYNNSLLDANLSGSGGSLLPINTEGSVSITNNNLVLTASGVSYVDYTVVNNAILDNQGTIEVHYIPNYGGNPSIIQNIVTIFDNININNDLLSLVHDIVGNLVFSLNDDTGAAIFSANFGTFNPVLGTTYVFQINFDAIDLVVALNRKARLFINGVQFGATSDGLSLGVRTSNSSTTIRIGGEATVSPAVGVNASNFSVDEFIVYSVIQNSANYTVSTIQLPQSVYAINNPLFLLKIPLLMDVVNTFVPTTVIVGSDEIKYTFQVNGKLMYHNGSIWTEVTLGFIHSNTISEVNAELATLLSDGDQVRVGIYLHSNTGALGTNPEIQELIIDFDYKDVTNELPPTCLVKIRVVDFRSVPVAGVVIQMKPVIADDIEFLAHAEKNGLIPDSTFEDLTNDDGKLNIPAIFSTKFLDTLVVQYEITATKEDIGYQATALVIVPELIEIDVRLILKPGVGLNGLVVQ